MLSKKIIEKKFLNDGYFDFGQILNNKELYLSMVNKSLIRAKIFNPEKFHNNIIKIYQEELKKLEL